MISAPFAAASSIAPSTLARVSARLVRSGAICTAAAFTMRSGTRVLPFQAGFRHGPQRLNALRPSLVQTVQVSS